MNFQDHTEAEQRQIAQGAKYKAGLLWDIKQDNLNEWIDALFVLNPECRCTEMDCSLPNDILLDVAELAQASW